MTRPSITWGPVFVRRLLPTLIVPLLALGACSAPTPRQAHRPRYQRAIDQGGPHRDPSSPSNQPAPEVELPAGPLGEAARWVLDTLAADSGPTEEEIGQRFAPKALEAALAPVLTQAFAQVRAMGPYTVTMWEGFGPSGAPG